MSDRIPPPPPPPGSPVPFVPAQPVTNGTAVAALVLGIIGLVMFWSIWLGVLLGVLAIVFGAVGRSRAARGAPNKGMATAGLVLGILAVLSSFLFLGLVVSVFEDSHGLIEELQNCVENPQDPDCQAGP